ncbi:MAG: DegV family protein [Eubacteriales bacterium]|nr:DegV family protein [Eubacteriales bacterium]
MKRFKIVVDSCCDVTNEYLNEHDITSVPLTITVDGTDYVDTTELDVSLLLDAVSDTTDPGTTSCPSPQAYLNAYQGHDEIFVVTLGSKVSGSYNSAVLASKLYAEKNPDAKVHVIDSSSAACAEVALARQLVDWRAAGRTFDEVIPDIEAMSANLKTYFLLDDMIALIKNGRIRGLKAFLVGKLNIKAIMSQRNGEIVQVSTGRGIVKALGNMAKIVQREAIANGSKILYITHINAMDKVRAFLDKVNANEIFQKIIINEGRGLSSFYARSGGLIVAF